MLIGEDRRHLIEQAQPLLDAAQLIALRHAVTTVHASAALIDYIQALLAHSRRRSEEHTSELQSLMRISYAVFCLKKKKTTETQKFKAHNTIHNTCTAIILYTNTMHTT